MAFSAVTIFHGGLLRDNEPRSGQVYTTSPPPFFHNYASILYILYYFYIFHIFYIRSSQVYTTLWGKHSITKRASCTNSSHNDTAGESLFWTPCTYESFRQETPIFLKNIYCHKCTVKRQSQVSRSQQ